MRHYLYSGIVALFIMPFNSLAQIKIQNIGESVNRTNISLESENVVIDLKRDNITATCTFVLRNYGDDVSLQMAFPHKYFQYDPLIYKWYARQSAKDYHISVDDMILGNKDLYFPPALDSLIQCFITFNKRSSVEEQMRLDQELQRLELKVETEAFKDANYAPWYIWDESFKENEKKTIEIRYSIPTNKVTTSIVGHEYFYVSRAFHYSLSVGCGWNVDDYKASIILNVNDNRVVKELELITPSNYTISSDSTCIVWQFNNSLPNQETEVYLQFCNKKQYPVWSPQYDPYAEDNW